MTRATPFLATLLGGLTLFAAALAAAPAPPPGERALFFDSRDHVETSAKPRARQVRPGECAGVAVIFDIDHGWHIWTDDRQLEAGIGKFSSAIFTRIDVLAPADGTLVPGPLHWPAHDTIDTDFGDGPQTFAVFEGRAIVYVPINVPEDAAPGSATLLIKATFQTCDHRSCMAPVFDHELPVTIEIVGADTTVAAPEADADFDGWDPKWCGERAGSAVNFDNFGWSFSLDVASVWGFILLLVVAAFGGFLLNFTPCVLPVIPIKIMGLSATAGNRRRMLLLGTIMSVGVVTMWLALGLAIALVAGFTSISRLYQFPAFMITAGVIIALMGLGALGLFSARLPQFVYRLNPSHDTLAGSFGFGVMTGILSTPCTAPFMGTAAAYGATLAPAQTLAIFGAIGLGMALPYQILSVFPHLVERMPRTGPASELIKQVMGLLILAVAAYFLGNGLSTALAEPPKPQSISFWWIVAAFGTAAGLWLLWRTVRLTRSFVRILVFGGLGVALVAISLAIGTILTDRGPIDWVYYTPQRFADAKQARKVVVMDFTAEWCLTCKALERTVLHRPHVVEILRSPDVAPIKVDLSLRSNTDANDMLRAVDRLTIPLLVVFDSKGNEVFKGDFYTADQVLDAVARARGTGQVAAAGK